MHLGIFAKTFPRPTLEATFDAVAAHGLTHAQFNMSCAGLPSMPDAIAPALCDRVARAAEARGLTMAAVSGTFNMAHPDESYRAGGLRRLGVLAEACVRMGTGAITLCTGSRDCENMWRRHPDNDSETAWDTLRLTTREAVRVAEAYEVTLAFEPEVANVVDSAARARRLLDEFRGAPLKVVIDPANLFHSGELPRMREVLEEAFYLIGSDIVLAHAKDLSRDSEAGHQPAGQGLLDYDLYLSLLREYGYNGPLILHGLDESQVAGSVAFLRAKLAAQGTA
jgi:sugar phosphate isomerase/epimerase